MMVKKSFDVVVIGAGIVGVSSALWLQREGLSVALVDRKEPGQGTSFGNAGVFADYAFYALNDPALPKKIPNKLFGKDHPVGMRYPYVLGMIPWFLQFLMNCRPKQADHIAHAIEYLCRHAKDGISPLLEDAKAFDLIDKRGAIELYNNKVDFDGSTKKTDILQKKQYRTRTIMPADLADLEPNFKLPFYKGVFYEDAWSLLNPGPMVGRLADHFKSAGGVFAQMDVERISKRPEGGVMLICGSTHIKAKQVVLAAGAFSCQIKGSGAERLPLETERGYHVMFDDAKDLISRPVGWTDMGVFVSPINGGIRAAGTVEFGGLSDVKSKARLEHIEKCVKRMLPDLKNMKRTSDWVGHRPTLPDSLPVIGRTREMPDVILAFGHQHLGMTLGGITGKLVSEIATNKPMTMDISAYSPDRFGV